MTTKTINVGLVGLGFGAEFIPLYKRHPNANLMALCQRSASKLDALAEKFGVPKRYNTFNDLLRDPEIDAVHINTPIAEHGQQAIAALKAGKHVACTVPMATSVEECREIVNLVKDTGKHYMMMETVVYAREFLHVKDLYQAGTLGRLQFLKASHQQDMDGWPGYWEGLPPMHYATHCVGPCLALANGTAEEVSCVGSGRIDDAAAEKHGSPFAIESCHIRLQNSDVCAHVYRSLFATARQYRESFDVYGSKASFEWPLVEGEPAILHTKGLPEAQIPAPIVIPDFAHRLPEALRPFTKAGVYNDDENQHLSFTQGGGHGGSHPHMVHEFLSALIANRAPFPNARQSANWTCVGLLAHLSALEGGRPMRLPAFTLQE